MHKGSATPRRRRWWLVFLVTAAVVVVGIPVVAISQFMISQAIGPVTEVTDADGSKRDVHWRHYPGVAGMDAEDVLDGPTVEEAYADGTAMVADIRKALTIDLGLEWASDPRTGKNYDPFHEQVENAYGGRSMLTAINATSWQTSADSASWVNKRHAVDIIAEVTARYGYSAPVLEDGERIGTHDRRPGGAAPEIRDVVPGIVHGSAGQWLAFTFQNHSKNADGRAAERLETSVGNGLEPDSISLSYGANGLLPAADRAEFERRLEPFLGLTPPPPLVS